ncbi:rCG59882, isoform CRA_a [Rattus norvegicus]|uniref:RCG59882, isoform CRA_a n=1 Tax=Rattus norvegicus TaxID=10116 RepID=A6HSJ4_RAT|nr:rCG59882, isoform CRA_a [Rattus norvegicus]EDM15879.1 rCG59882, isoform CRA_a [Rattus norvegicus]
MELSRREGTTTLTRTHPNNMEGQQDMDSCRAARSSLDSSKFKDHPRLSQSPLGGPLGQSHLETPPLPPTPICRTSLAMNSHPEDLKKGASRSSSRDARETFREACLGPEGQDSRSSEQRTLPLGKKDTAIPENIRHKFGSKMVDQLISEIRLCRPLVKSLRARRGQAHGLAGPRALCKSPPFSQTTMTWATTCGPTCFKAHPKRQRAS